MGGAAGAPTRPHHSFLTGLFLRASICLTIITERSLWGRQSQTQGNQGKQDAGEMEQHWGPCNGVQSREMLQGRPARGQSAQRRLGGGGTRAPS